MAGTPNVRLKLANRAENVLLVRQALSGVADVVGLDAIALNDISTAVTEACNNVVLHAYGGDEGPLEVELSTVHEGIDVLVRDRGEGIRPGVKAAEEVSGGIGLPVIQALSESVDFRDVPGGGTEVAMRFEAPQARPAEDEPDDSSYDDSAATALDGEHERTRDVLAMTVGPCSIASGVLPRVLSTLAARAYFTTDSISDTQRLADALVSRSAHSIAAARMSLGVSVAPRHLDMRIGPLESGRAGALLAAGEGEESLSGILERVLEGHEVRRVGTLEMLDLRLFQRN
jgi:serine/threonine-protein kinase RsbW